MTPFPLYHLFREHFTALEPALVEAVCSAATPDCIFLLGASVHHRRTESIFSGPAPSAQHIGSCTLLVLLEELGGWDIHQWQDKIEAHCSAALLPLTTLVVRTGRFEEWLRERHRFALSVRQSAPVLYRKDTAVLSPPGDEGPPAPSRDDERAHSAGLLKAAEFLCGAGLFHLRRQYALSAFMLHQSAEQALSTLVRTGTGFSPHTHSLDRLLRYSALVSCRVPDLFPRQTEKDKRLFRLLQKAYTEPRYEDYSICEQDLLLLTSRVQELHKLLAALGKQLFTPQPLTATP